MSTNSETGHTVNVANFNAMIVIVEAYGPTYNPSNPLISLPALQIASNNARTALNEVNNTFSAYNLAIGGRNEGFEPLGRLATRALNALISLGAIGQVINNARTIVRKIHGTRTSSKMTAEELAALAAQGQEVKQISSSQMSYNNRLENFTKLIDLLDAVPAYSPNETELTISSLLALSAELAVKNNSAMVADTNLTKARINRDQVLYAETTGICSLAANVKAYAKSLYGASGPLYKQVAKLSFRSKKMPKQDSLPVA
jgi:hypothetical protein